MFNLRSSCFGDIDMTIEEDYLLNDNLYKLIFDFCDAEDLSKISLCSKSIFEEIYCSSYENYE